MTKQQGRTLLILAGVGLLYFIAFIFPNLTGAEDANMLALFEVDEYAQYPHVIRMLTPGPNAYQTIRNFFIYLHYYYGFPFYFFSALSILPIKLISGLGWSEQTALIVMVLRQIINVLPMLISVLLLVYMQTKFKSLWKSIGLFILLLSIPAIVVNNQWWHPDSLVFLFIVLTIFFLHRDELQFKKNFFFAAISCGLAIGTKHLGIFFVLTIPAYLIWGLIGKHITLKKSIFHAILFVVVMTLTVVASNPLLLLPIERGEIINIFKVQWIQSSTGVLLANTDPFFTWGNYPEDFRIHYGELFFILLTLASVIVGVIKKEKRLLNFLILTWMIPLTSIILIFGTRRTHYFIPVLLPAFSCLINYFPNFNKASDIVKTKDWGTRIKQIVLPIIIGSLIIVQFVIFLGTDVSIYKQTLNRENASPSIGFYSDIEGMLSSKLEDEKLVIYRDWRIYFPPNDNWRVEMNWDMGSYDYINDLNPDLIILETENVQLFADPDTIHKAVEPDEMRVLNAFYGDAARDELPGYKLLYRDGFGYVLLRDVLYEKYYAP